MKTPISLLCGLVILLSIVGCDTSPGSVGRVVLHDPPPAESPVAVNLPVALRQTNWADSGGSGSCVIASTCSMVRYQLNFAAADFMRRNYAGGQTASSIRQKLDAMRLPYAVGRQNDVSFLQWASETRRGAIIWYYQSHCVTFCGFENYNGRDVAVLLDNNRVRNFIRIPRDEFIQAWRGYGGFALTVLGPPVPPPLYERWTHESDSDDPYLRPRRPADSLLDRLFVRLRGGQAFGV